MRSLLSLFSGEDMLRAARQSREETMATLAFEFEEITARERQRRRDQRLARGRAVARAAGDRRRHGKGVRPGARGDIDRLASGGSARGGRGDARALASAVSALAAR